ncbi:ATP-binding protein [Crossiella cryophila]|uniref:Uncharacterized protein n=1 Tax=Crossiella cryophila TaxID=43355 RepID=A0A7W7FY26_9PSEU|nr:ATP-binding protein [Crossiella cryophila]MBB4679614.1 hypothetical protein [Crossiella cryophila]
MRHEWRLLRLSQRGTSRLGLRFGGPHRRSNLTVVRVSTDHTQRRITMINTTAPVLDALETVGERGAVVDATGLGALLAALTRESEEPSGACTLDFRTAETGLRRVELTLADGEDLVITGGPLTGLAVPEGTTLIRLTVDRPGRGREVAEYWPGPAASATAATALRDLLDLLAVLGSGENALPGLDWSATFDHATTRPAEIVRWRPLAVFPLHGRGGAYRNSTHAVLVSGQDDTRLVLAETLSPSLDALEFLDDRAGPRLPLEGTGDLLGTRLAALPGDGLADPAIWQVSAGGRTRALPVTVADGHVSVGDCDGTIDLPPGEPRIQLRLAGPAGPARVLEYWPGRVEPVALYEVLTRVLRLLVHRGHQELDGIRVPRPAPRALRPDAVSMTEALPATLRLAAGLWTEAPPTGAGAREEASQFIQQMLMDPHDPDRARWVLRHYAPEIDVVTGRRQGRTALAALAAESLLAQACDGAEEPGADRVFARALTAYLRAHVGENAINRPRITSRVCNLMHEWITRRPQRPYPPRYSLDARTVGTTAIERLNGLVRHAPWLEYYVKARPISGIVRLELSPAELLALLVLVRPRTSHIGTANQTAAAASQPNAFASLDLTALAFRYVLPDGLLAAIEEQSWLANDLARACERLFFAPQEALRAVQVLAPLGEIATLVDTHAKAAVAGRYSGLADAVVLVDRPPGRPARPVVVNTNPVGRMLADLGGVTVELAEFAPDTAHAAGYTSPPVWLEVVEGGRTALTVGEQTREIALPERTRLGPSSTPGSVWVHDNLFRGRADQLVRLTGAMRPDRRPRTPIAIFGPRRAGKTTLAMHACRRGLATGLLTGFIPIDMFVDVDGTRPDGYEQRLAALLANRFSEQTGLAPGTDQHDLIAVLTEADRALAGRGTVAVVLDEFDTLLSAAEGSTLHRLALRLGGLRWQNLALIATVQRFHRDAADLSTWEFVECPADLSWPDCVTYFCPQLADPVRWQGDPPLLDAPVVLPRDVRDVVVARLGLRPYFWGRLRSQLENYLAAENGYAVTKRDLVDHIIDTMVEADPFLCLPAQDTEGVSLAECRRRDLYSGPEKRVLAHFARNGAKGMPETEAAELGGPQALLDLLDRAHLRREANQYRLAVPLFGEYLVRHSLYFEAFGPNGRGIDEF